MKITGLLSSSWKTTWIVLIIGLARCHAQAQCASVQAEYMAESATESKCSNFAEFPGYVSTPPKYYLQCKVVVTGSGSEDSDYTYFGYLYMEVPTGSINTTTTYLYNYLYCTNTIVYSGSAKYGVLWAEAGPVNTLSESETEDSSGNWTESDDGNAGNDANNLFTQITGIGGLTPVFTTNSTTISSQESGTGYDDTYGSWSVKLTTTTILSSEFTDTLLRSKVIYYIPQFPNPASWTTNYADSFGSAFYDYSDSTHTTASGGMMEYHFHIFDCQPHTSYWLTWDEVTTYPNNSQPPSVQHMQEEVEGTGDPDGVYSEIHLVGVPGTPSTISVNNYQVTYSPWDISGH